VFVKVSVRQGSPVAGSTAPGGAFAHAGEIDGMLVEVGGSVDEGEPSTCVGGVGGCVGSAPGSCVLVESSDDGQGSPVVGSTAPGGALTHAGEIGGVSVGTDGSAIPVDEGSPSAGGCVGSAPGSCVPESSDDGQGSPVVGSTAPGGALTHAGEIGGVSVGTDGSAMPVDEGSPSAGGCVGSAPGSWVSGDDGQGSPVVGSTAPGGAFTHADETGGVSVGTDGSAMPVDEGSPSAGGCVGSAPGSVESSDDGQGSPVVGSTAPGGALTHAGEGGGVSVGTDGSVMPVDEGSPSAGGCVGSAPGSCVPESSDDGQGSPVVGSMVPGGAFTHAGEIGEVSVGTDGSAMPVDEGSPSAGGCVGSAPGSWVFVDSGDNGQGSPVVGSTVPGGAFTHADEIGGVSVGTDGSAIPVDERSPSAGGCVGSAPGSWVSVDNGQGSPVLGSTVPGGAFTHAGEIGGVSVTPVAVGSALGTVESATVPVTPVPVGTAVLVDDGGRSVGVRLGSVSEGS
jgi:hypothetical protein